MNILPTQKLNPVPKKGVEIRTPTICEIVSPLIDSWSKPEVDATVACSAALGSDVPIVCCWPACIIDTAQSRAWMYGWHTLDMAVLQNTSRYWVSCSMVSATVRPLKCCSAPIYFTGICMQTQGPHSLPSVPCDRLPASVRNTAPALQDVLTTCVSCMLAYLREMLK